ncbi:MAG: hypothetical protein KOO60_00835 [Gemmatimonadales bacterium]|nr:hypothetical protein [Gemmatimonadales bacterium]
MLQQKFLLTLAALWFSGTAAAEPLPSPDIQIYYFHNTFRCPTCLSMEYMAEEMIRDEFEEDLDAGIIAWDPVNVQEPGHEDLVEAYDLDGPTLIMVEQEDGKVLRWKNLERIWYLADSPAQYRAYVRNELNGYLNGEPEAEDDPQQ